MNKHNQLPEWRESLAVEGDLTRASAADVTAFLEWAESRTLVVPRYMQAVAVLLPLLTLGLLLLFFTGATDAAWWLPSLLIAIVLSYGFASRMYRVFDRATVGQQALERYAAMLDLACGSGWRAPPLIRLEAALCAGGQAPILLRKLARIAGWS